MRKVITYGTFDLLHIGHVNILRKAKNLGDYLIVALSTDEFNMIKNKESYFNYIDRKKVLDAIKYVDSIIPEESWDQKVRNIKEMGISTFVMGNDWEGKFDYLKDYCEVIYLPRTTGISTSKIKMDLSVKKNES